MTPAETERRILTFADFDKKECRRCFWLPTLRLAAWWHRQAWDLGWERLDRAKSVRWMYVFHLYWWSVVVWGPKVRPALES